MKPSIFALSIVLCSTSDAFAPTHQSTTRNTVTSLDATSRKNKNANFAFAVALGFGIATTATIAAPSVAFAEEYADFSLPSYKAALESPTNANLKGDNYLIKTPFGGTVSTDGTFSTQEVKAEATPEKQVVAETKEDAAISKAEAKARQKEARARQMAAAAAAAN